MKVTTLLLVPFLAISVTNAQDSNKHECHVFAVDITAALKAEKQLFVVAGNSKEYRSAMAAADQIIGRFEAVVAEEHSTTQSYPLPGTDLVVTATVFYTDESLPLTGGSVTLAVVMGKMAVPNAIADPNAALAEADLEPDTFIVNVRQRFLLEGKPWMIGVQCQTMSDEARKRQILEQQER